MSRQNDKFGDDKITKFSYNFYIFFVCVETRKIKQNVNQTFKGISHGFNSSMSQIDANESANEIK